MGKRNFSKDVTSDWLLKWQRILDPDQSEKRYTLKQLYNKTDKEITRLLSFIKKTRKVLKNETDVNSFFTHLNAIQQSYCRIEILESFQKNSCSQKSIVRDYNFLKKQTDLLLKNFIYNSCIQEIKKNLDKQKSSSNDYAIPNNLSRCNLLEISAKVRLNLLNLWFVQISEHFSEMTAETIQITCVLYGILDDI